MIDWRECFRSLFAIMIIIIIIAPSSIRMMGLQNRSGQSIVPRSTESLYKCEESKSAVFEWRHLQRRMESAHM